MWGIGHRRVATAEFKVIDNAPEAAASSKAAGIKQNETLRRNGLCTTWQGGGSCPVPQSPSTQIRLRLPKCVSASGARRSRCWIQGISPMKTPTSQGVRPQIPADACRLRLRLRLANRWPAVMPRILKYEAAINVTRFIREEIQVSSLTCTECAMCWGEGSDKNGDLQWSWRRTGVALVALPALHAIWSPIPRIKSSQSNWWCSTIKENLRSP